MVVQKRILYGISRYVLQEFTTAYKEHALLVAVRDIIFWNAKMVVSLSPPLSKTLVFNLQLVTVHNSINLLSVCDTR